MINDKLNMVVAICILFLGVCTGSVFAVPVEVDLAGSTPSHNGSEWGTFDANQIHPNKGGIVLMYQIPDFTAYPIDSSGATVTLRPSSDLASVISCDNLDGSPPPNPPSDTEIGKCYYAVIFNQILIYYMGSLSAGESVAYSVAGLVSADPVNFTFNDFDSTSVAGGITPENGRNAARLVMVLDKSGSMKWSANPAKAGCEGYTDPAPGCEPARWDILTRAVEQTLIIAKAYAIPDDRFAVALFDSSVTNSNRFDFSTINQTTVNDFMSSLAALEPGGSTSIGAGMETFEADLNAGNTSTLNQVVLLFTDGDYNTAPYLVSNGVDVIINPTSPNSVGADLRPYLEQDGVVDGEYKAKICPFALRADNPSGTLTSTYLQEIANLRCDGQFNSAMSFEPNDSDLFSYFIDILNLTLYGDKLELVNVANGSLASRDEGNIVDEKFVISKDDIAFTSLLSWEPFAKSKPFIGMEWIKDGVSFDLGPVATGGFHGILTAQVDYGGEYISATMRPPFCNKDKKCVSGEGEWILRIKYLNRRSTEKLKYNLYTVSDNKTIAAEYFIKQETSGVNNPVSLEVVLKEAGSPITGLTVGSVKAVLTRPDAGLGNVLSAGPNDTADNSSLDSIGTAGLKVSAMLSNPSQRSAILSALKNTVSQSFTLTETDPGVYSAVYNNANVDGFYKVTFHVDGETATNGRFTRVRNGGRYVPVVPDEIATLNNFSEIAIPDCSYPGGCYGIELKPVDSAGNLLGPGKTNLFTMPGFEGVLLAPIEDKLNGTYVIKIGYPAGVTERPTINIFGVEITPNVGPGAGGIINDIIYWIMNHILWFLLILILLFILIVILIRILRNS